MKGFLKRGQTRGDAWREGMREREDGERDRGLEFVLDQVRGGETEKMRGGKVTEGERGRQRE